MPDFRELFPVLKPIIGMIHVWGMREVRQAILDLGSLQTALIGETVVDGVIVENYGWGQIDRNRTAAWATDEITRVAREIVGRALIPVGINLLPNDFELAFSAAESSGAQFVQLDHVTGEFRGQVDSVDPVRLREIRGRHPRVVLLGGIHPKYYELVDRTRDIGESAKVAQDLCDAIVVTGEHTGGETSLSDLEKVKRAVGSFPVLVGSGLTAENVREQLAVADGAIVGSAFKRRGVIPGEPVDFNLVVTLMREVKRLRLEKAD